MQIRGSTIQFFRPRLRFGISLCAGVNAFYSRGGGGAVGIYKWCKFRAEENIVLATAGTMSMVLSAYIDPKALRTAVNF